MWMAIYLEAYYQDWCNVCWHEGWRIRNRKEWLAFTASGMVTQGVHKEQDDMVRAGRQLLAEVECATDR
jgi:hypothetical protein